MPTTTPLRLTVLGSTLLLCLSCFVAPTPHAAAAEPHPVATAQPSTRSVTLVGFTRAGAVMTLVSELAGKVLEVRADVGDVISRTGVYAVLDDTFTRLDLEKVLVEQARLRSNIAYFTKETRRYQELVTRDSAAQAQLDELQLQLEEARHQLDALQVEQERLEEQRARFVINAPPGWTVMERRIEPGEWVNVGEPLGELGDFRTLVVPFALTPEEYEWLMNQRGPIALTMPDATEPPGQVTASVGRISPGFNPETRKIHVELEIPAQDAVRRGGRRVTLAMRIPDARDTVLLPPETLQRRYDEYWATREDGEEFKVVLLGEGPDGLVRVTAPNVRAGDRFRLQD